MRYRKRVMGAAAFGMIVLILDARAVLAAAQEGVQLCIRTLIPSLLPFFIFSILLTSSISGQAFRILSPLEKLCRIPRGSGALLLIGLLGGYPVGAQNVTISYKKRELSKKDAERMLAFCNNAGPAFLFGMVGQAFGDPLCPWLLWGIHILSALLTAVLISGKSAEAAACGEEKPLALPQALEKSLRVMAVVCGWVIFFRIVIGVLERWILWLLPLEAQVLIKGLLELSNGCVLLAQIPSAGLRFIIASVLLAFGGVCVSMQTASVCEELSRRMYFRGKLMQTAISLLLSYLLQAFIAEESMMFVLPAALACLVSIFLLRKPKNKGSIPALSGV